MAATKSEHDWLILWRKTFGSVLNIDTQDRYQANNRFNNILAQLLDTSKSMLHAVKYIIYTVSCCSFSPPTRSFNALKYCGQPTSLALPCLFFSRHGQRSSCHNTKRLHYSNTVHAWNFWKLNLWKYIIRDCSLFFEPTCANCTVGSYASLSVCPSVRPSGLDQKSD